jgi:hypothetical protein
MIELQKLHLEQAKERGAAVFDFGDLFDAMQGKTDRRSSKADLLAELAGGGSYLNGLVEMAVDLLEPYVDNIALISKGNHETGVSNKVEYDLHSGLLYSLSKCGGGHIINGGYRGWIKYQFVHVGNDGTESNRKSRNGYYHHGYGGGGPVTKGVIQANRKAVYLSNADYVFSGHTHESWLFPIERVRLTNSSKEERVTQWHVQLPTYKEEFVDQPGGWHHETGKPPKPTGAWWMRFYWSGRLNDIDVQFIPADK